jgi:hypothetical protein
MGKLSTKSASHRYLTNFVDWVRAEPNTEDKIREQAEDIRSRIKAKANDDGIVVRSTPWSGSFAKKTGLRRHKRGNHEIEGQDIDLPFVVSPKDEEGKKLDKLLDRFDRYAAAVYPSTERTRTKSSICLNFKASKLSYDLVPMLAVEGDDLAQILIRADGEKRWTSVQQHISFIKTRTDKSNLLDGRVKFHEVVRLVKWWREMRQSESDVLGEVPTIIIDLLCAKAFDEHQVDETYTETLSRWFGRCAHIVRNRKRVDFKDFVDPSKSSSSGLWTVLDPVNSENNVVPKSWTNLQLDELAEWFEEARDAMARVITADTKGDETAAVAELVVLFGNAIKSHGGK